MSEKNEAGRQLSHGELLQLKRWNTPSIYNGWEMITSHDIFTEGFNLEETHDFMPQTGPIVGYAITVVCELSNPEHGKNAVETWKKYRAYVASIPGPKIVVVQDLDKPRVIGSFWGEVSSNDHRALGCVGTITDGAVRDIDEMGTAGFKAIARRLAVGHACTCPVRWNCEVEVFGRKIKPGQLIHADKHGFLVIPEEDQKPLLEAVEFSDRNECMTKIAVSRGSAGKPTEQVVAEMGAAVEDHIAAAKKKYERKGE